MLLCVFFISFEDVYKKINLEVQKQAFQMFLQRDAAGDISNWPT